MSPVNKRVYVVERVEAAKSLWSIGLKGLAWPNGSEDLRMARFQAVKGKEVMVLPANNQAGREHAKSVLAALATLQPPPAVKVVELPRVPDGGDVLDWINGHGDAAEPAELRRQLETLADQAEALKLSSNETTRRVCTVRLSDAASRPVEWLWPGRIPSGKVTLLSGDPGLGKSYLTLSMAAHVSRGSVWPDRAAAPSLGTVILFSAEDDVEDTIRPRLELMGADLSAIVAVNGVRCADGGRREFNLVDDLDPLKDLLREHPNSRLLVVDPISAYCGRTESHKNAEVRAMLAPLATLAAEHGVAIVAVTHLSKGVGGKAVYRSSGSLAFAAAARAVWHVGRDRDDPTRRLLLPVKMNLSPDPTGMAYRILDGCVVWETEPVAMTADDLLASETDHQPGDPTEREQAGDWLHELLAAGPLPAGDVQKQARDCGFSGATLRRAKKALRVVVKREGFGADGKWHWALPTFIDAHPAHRCSPEDVSTYDENEHLWDPFTEEGQT